MSPSSNQKEIFHTSESFPNHSSHIVAMFKLATLSPTSLMSSGASQAACFSTTCSVCVRGIGKVKEKTVREMFEKIGAVKSIRMMTYPNETPTGTCVVEYARTDSALQAIDKLNLTPYGNTNLSVTKSKPQKEYTAHEWGRTRPHPDSKGQGVFLAHAQATTAEIQEFVHNKGIRREHILKFQCLGRTSLLELATVGLAVSTIKKMDNSTFKDEPVRSCVSLRDVFHRHSRPNCQ
eukprot:Filipodium_phascolosomae@DN7855_c0_g1_i1.p1